MDPTQSITSLTLMRKLRANPRDTQAWNAFISVYGPRIDAWCRRWKLQESDVQDVTQEVLLKLSKQFGTFDYDPAKGFRKWLRTVTEHALCDFANSRSKQPTTMVTEFLQDVECRKDLMERLSDVFDLEVLEEAKSRVISQVDEKHWQVFELTSQSKTGAEVAKLTGISVANVYKIKSRVQQQVRQEIEELNREIGD